jgi:hypothetical protein
MSKFDFVISVKMWPTLTGVRFKEVANFTGFTILLYLLKRKNAFRKTRALTESAFHGGNFSYRNAFLKLQFIKIMHKKLLNIVIIINLCTVPYTMCILYKDWLYWFGCGLFRSNCKTSS